MKHNPRGRPPLDDDDESVPVCVKMPARQYDQLFKRAQEARVSVPEIMRRDTRAAQKRNPK